MICSSEGIKLSLYNMMKAFSFDTARNWLCYTFDSFISIDYLSEKVQPEPKKVLSSLVQFSDSVKDVCILGKIKRLPVFWGSKVFVTIPVIAVQTNFKIFQEHKGKRIYFSQCFHEHRLFSTYSELASAILFSSTIKKYIKNSFQAGLLFFYDDTGNFRLTFLRKIADSESMTRSFLCIRSFENKICYSKLGRKFTSFDELCTAFSIKKLAADFYSEISEWLQYALSSQISFSFPDYSNELISEKEKKKESLLRLFLRLIFTWLIRSSDQLSEDLFSEEKLKNIIKLFNPYSGEQECYYRCILQNLFFATFNIKKNKRKFIPTDFRGKYGGYGVKNRYRYSTEFINPTAFINTYMQQIPFLNCSLFDCLDETSLAGERRLLDGFSNVKRRQAHIPNALFFGDHGIITRLRHYEFSLEDSTQHDAALIINPYLISMVLENLLSENRPESAESATTRKGYYYLPRDLLEAITKGALKNFLVTKHIKFRKKEWNILLSDNIEDSVQMDEGKATSLFQTLLQSRILDPCCGSGIFPLSVLRYLSCIFLHCYPNYNLWQKMITSEKIKRILPMDTGDNPTEKLSLSRTEQSNFQKQQISIYHLNLTLLKNCIYGVDIRALSVLSSCLQNYLYLLSLQLKIFGEFLALPNLEANFVTADSLTSLDYGNIALAADQEIQQIRCELKKLHTSFLLASTMASREKCRKREHELRRKLQEKIAQLLRRSSVAFRDSSGNTAYPGEYYSEREKKITEIALQIAERNPYKQNSCSSFFDPEWMFNITDGFDIIIGEPPYYGLASEITAEIAGSGKFSERNEYIRAVCSGDLYLPFTEYSVSAYLKKHGVFAMIIP